MQSAIRFVGVLNLAIWLGAAVFFTVAAGPAFFSTEMLSLLPRPYAGRAAEIMIERYFLFHQCCAVVALVHLAAEYLLRGRFPGKAVLAGYLALLGAGVAGNLWLLPHLHQLQRVRYSLAATAAQKAEAASAFGLWHGVSEAVNLGVILLLAVFLWQLARPQLGPSFAAGPPRLTR